MEVTIYKYECPREQWTEFINAMNSGEKIEIDEEMYYYWLEVLPPARYYDGGGFGFAEGIDNITKFWREGEVYYCQRTKEIKTWD